MKKIICIFFPGIFFYCYSHSQIYKAGYFLNLYFDITPDTLINYNCSPSNTSTESYYFDVNTDAQNDIEIKAYCAVGGPFTDAFISINSVNSDSYIRFGRYDSVYNNFGGYWMIEKVAKPLYYGDTINSGNAIWDSTSLILTDNSNMTGTFQIITDWQDTNDLYVGIKHQTLTDTIYGWIRINCPYLNECYLKDYSLGSSTMYVTNISNNVYLLISPNPSSGIFTIKTDQEIESIDVISVLGKKVQTGNGQCAGSNRQEIDLTNQPTGIYFVKIQTDKGIVNKKLVMAK